MEKRKLRNLLLLQVVLLFYLLLNLAIYFLSKREGTEGVSLLIFGGSDDGRFYWNQVKSYLGGGEIIGTSLYPYIIAYLVKVTHIQDVVIIRIFNYSAFVFLVLATLYLAKLLLGLEKKNNKNYTIVPILLFYLFYLSMLMNVNLSIYRDVWIYLFYVLSLILSIKIFFYKKYILILPFVFCLLILGGLRDYALLSFGANLLIYAFFNKKKNIRRILLYLLIAFILYYTFFIDYKLPIVGMSLRDALGYRELGMEFLAGNSQMDIKLEQSNFLLFSLYYTYSIISNFLGPLPWQISGGSTLIVFLFESIPMMFIVFYILRNKIYLSTVQNYCLIHALVWTMLISMINDNIGTATRLRALSWIIVLTVFTTIIQRKKENSFINSKE